MEGIKAKLEKLKSSAKASVKNKMLEKLKSKFKKSDKEAAITNKEVPSIPAESKEVPSSSDTLAEAEKVAEVKEIVEAKGAEAVDTVVTSKDQLQEKLIESETVEQATELVQAHATEVENKIVDAKAEIEEKVTEITSQVEEKLKTSE